MRQTLIQIGHAPRIRGGNGRPLPLSQKNLLAALGDGWKTEHVESCRTWRGSGLPTHYKIDLANPKKMIAVEIDGPSHFHLARKAQDARKTRFLESTGWSVFRFTNQQVVENMDQIVTFLSSISPSSPPTHTSSAVP
jgi:very-short-patch-repair endonuclease